MSNEFADAEALLLDQVAASVTLQGSVLAFLETLEAQLTSALTQDPQNVLKALKSLKDSSAALAANLLANTPHDPAPAPAPAPVEAAPAPVSAEPDPVVEVQPAPVEATEAPPAV